MNYATQLKSPKALTELFESALEGVCGLYHKELEKWLSSEMEKINPPVISRWIRERKNLKFVGGYLERNKIILREKNLNSTARTFELVKNGEVVGEFYWSISTIWSGPFQCYP